VKVVFDTDILVSALAFPGGRGEAALWRIVSLLEYASADTSVRGDKADYRPVRVTPAPVAHHQVMYSAASIRTITSEAQLKPALVLVSTAL